ncbi:putative O-methyltransferase domain-containing protein [Seiridium cardinale]
MTFRTLEQLADVVGRTSTALSKGLADRLLTSPTVVDIQPTSLREIDPNATKELVNAARELECLVQGPGQMLSILAFAYHDITSLGTLIEFNIPSLVPLDGTVSIAALASQTGLSEDKLSRIIRYATTNFIFYEPSPGNIAHSAASAALARDEQFSMFLRLVLVELAPIAVSLPAACKKWPQSEKPNECGVNAMSGTNDKFFEWLSRDARRQETFDAGMAGFSGAAGENGDRPQSVDVTAYPWVEKLGKAAKVVDVGGGSGHVSQALACTYPGFSLTVQDRPEAIKSNSSQPNLPPNLTFQAHNFFSPQVLHGADAYFLRQIMHDWPEAEAVSILRALIPALKPGARVLVSEYVVPATKRLNENQAMSLLDAKMVRQMDLQMMAVFNSKERTVEDFAKLFAKADPRLRFAGTYQIPEDPKSCIFEAIWEEQ